MRDFLATIRAATKDAEPVIETILAVMILALAGVGCVEAPWIAPHFVQENNNG